MWFSPMPMARWLHTVGHMKRIVAAAAGVTALALALGIPQVHADEAGMTLTASPNTGLVDGQTINLSGQNFPKHMTYHFEECSASTCTPLSGSIYNNEGTYFVNFAVIVQDKIGSNACSVWGCYIQPKWEYADGGAPLPTSAPSATIDFGTVATTTSSTIASTTTSSTLATTTTTTAAPRRNEALVKAIRTLLTRVRIWRG